MQIKKSIASDQSTDIANEQSISTDSIDRMPSPRSNMQMVQNVLLIWLDQSINENNADCQDTIKQLRNVINTINTVTDIDSCIQFLKYAQDEKVCLIVSGSFGKHIVPQVHQLSQVDSIFIFCDDKEYHEQWIMEWSKIKGVFTEISLICEALKKAAQECEQNTISISILPTGDGTKKNLDQLESSFMYMQIMKEILLDIKFERQHFEQYIDYCCQLFAENDRELRNITKFEQQYADKTPIWWYTLESFLYPMVNRALRTMDADIIIKIGFFIKDLHQHIEQLHKEQFDDADSEEKFIVYRGQGMSKTEFEHLTKTKGGLISFNNFLSTSKKRSVSLQFANNALANPDLMGVLFVMTIDLLQTTTPFASVKNVSAIRSEDEVLFAMQTVFRIVDITSMDGNSRLFQVELTLTSNNDKDLRQLTDHIRQETYPDEKGWFRFGTVLYKLGRFDKCEEVYRTLLEQATSDSEKADIYLHLGLAKKAQGEYHEAIAYQEKAAEIYKRNLPSNNVRLADTYNHIGVVYKNMGEYFKALSYYEQSLEIKQQSLSPNHRDLASTYSNIAGVYLSIGEYSKALSYSEKALEIDQTSLPPNHPYLAASYNCTGIVYETMGEHVKAVSHYEKALAIRQQSLPPNHPDLAMSHNNIGNVYDDMGEHLNALSHYEKSLEIQQQSLSPNHPDLAMSYENIGILYARMGEHAKALSYFENSLEINQKSFSSMHPRLAAAYDNLAQLHEDMGDFSKALLFSERAVNTAQQSLPSNHPDVQEWIRHRQRIEQKL